ncbi:hypothetical protein [Paraburkholderia unamae]|uniref:hypothetical protein n=1 Tax=Paraburkholderia unamae TaxID=219649 RepID=UPI0011BDF492|nr:hypothetical protein [Paraburkholderia unamae]
MKLLAAAVESGASVKPSAAKTSPHRMNARARHAAKRERLGRCRGQRHDDAGRNDLLRALDRH